MATWPSDVLDFCGLGAVGTFVYAVCLTLEDPTARLRALLYGEDAVYLILTSLKIVIEEMMPPLSLSVGWDSDCPPVLTAKIATCVVLC